MPRLPGVYEFFNQSLFSDVNDVWIISDTHFGENDLKQAFPNRPSDDELVKIINSKCGKNSALIHLGDVGDTSYIPQLRAKTKILICGNHDAGTTNYKRQINYKLFDQDQFQKQEALDEMKHLYPNCRYSIEEGHQFHSPFTYWRVEADNKMFDQVFQGPLVLGEKLILSHEPIDVSWAYSLHGHNHNGVPNPDNHHRNCALEVNNYQPINLNQLLKSGVIGHIESLHRDTIDTATVKARKRKRK